MFFNQKRKFTGLPFMTTLLATFGAVLLIVPVTPVHAADIGLSTADKAASTAGETVTGDITTVAGLCEHHTEHTDECLAGTPCSHTHTQDCYRQVKRYATSVLDCHHEHNEDCSYEEGSACSYSCGSCHENRQDSAASGNTYSNSRKSHHGSHHSRRHHC